MYGEKKQDLVSYLLLGLDFSFFRCYTSNLHYSLTTVFTLTSAWPHHFFTTLKSHKVLETTHSGTMASFAMCAWALCCCYTHCTYYTLCMNACMAIYTVLGIHMVHGVYLEYKLFRQEELALRWRLLAAWVSDSSANAASVIPESTVPIPKARLTSTKEVCWVSGYTFLLCGSPISRPRPAFRHLWQAWQRG